jgi:hypothetical protein
MTNTTSARYLPGTNIPTLTESKRLDDLTAYNSTILGHLTGDKLDALTLTKRWPGRSDEAMREHILNHIHPDDLAEVLITRGYSLASFGIEAITLTTKSTP